MVNITLCNAKSAAGIGPDCFISYFVLFIFIFMFPVFNCPDITAPVDLA